MRAVVVGLLLVAGFCALGAQAVGACTYNDFVNNVVNACVMPSSLLASVLVHCPSKSCRDAAVAYFPVGNAAACYDSVVSSAGAVNTAQTIAAAVTINSIYASCNVPQPQAASSSATAFAAAQLTSLAAACPSFFGSFGFPTTCDETCAAGYRHALTFSGWSSALSDLTSSDAQAAFQASTTGARINDISGSLNAISSTCAGTTESDPVVLPQNTNVTIYSGALWTASTIGVITAPKSQRNCIAYDAKLLPNVGFVVQEVNGFEYCCLNRGTLGTDPNNGEADTACLSGCGSSVAARSGLFVVQSTSVCFSSCFLA